MANISYAVVLLPPLAISLCFPDLFFKAADLAGVYGVAILYGVLPPLFAFVMRRKQVIVGEHFASLTDPTDCFSILSLFYVMRPDCVFAAIKISTQTRWYSLSKMLKVYVQPDQFTSRG